MDWSAAGGRIGHSNPKLAHHRSSELRIAVRRRAERQNVIVAYLTIAALIVGVAWGVYTSLL